MLTSLLEIIRDLPGFKKQSARTWAGPCPQCGGNDRFIVWVGEDRFSCRGCDFKGDIITWLRQIEGKTCGEAFLAAGRHCDSHDCDARGKCAATRESGSAPRTGKQRKLCTPKEKTGRDDWRPTAAATPAETWQERALALVSESHDQLLSDPQQLDYLARRGLPRGAVEKNRLGWIDKDIYRSRAAWGLSPTKQKKGGGETSTLWIPGGLVIPMFAPGGLQVHRIRIRRHKIAQGEPRYYWLEGSGDDTWILNPTARAFVVVETDLDGLMIDWHAGDLIGTVPLGSCSPRPKQNAADILDRAVCILNALDFEPRTNEQTGRNESPGGENWLRWWKPRYPQAKRHPAPGGKDPGEAYQNGTDIRSWIVAGLPLGLRPAQPQDKHESSVCEIAQVAEKPLPVPSSESRVPEAVPSRIIEGRQVWFPRTPEEWRRLVAEGKIVFGPKEAKVMMDAPCQLPSASLLLDIKEIFPGACLTGIEKIS